MEAKYSKRIKVIGIGDNVCDKYYPRRVMYPGGQALNFSVYAGMLGASSAYLGVFGGDDVATHILKTLDELSVEHDRCRCYEGENGYAEVELIDGDRRFIRSNRGGIVNEHPLELSDEDIEYLKGFRLMHLSNNGHTDHLLSKLKEIGPKLSYDVSGRWKEDHYLNDVAPYADLIFMSCGDLHEDEIKEVLKRYQAKGCEIVIATRGSKGSIAYDGERYHSEPPKKVDAVDTLGAGDSFATAFMIARLRGLDIDEAMKEGASFAAKTCMKDGAFGYGKAF